MELNLLTDWNPWWEEKKSIKRKTGKPRPSYENLLNSITLKHVTIITGIRRSGKSTLMYQMIEGLLERGINPEQILFINLEDARLTNYTLEEIYNTYRQTLNPEKKSYIFLDEIHKKKEWEKWIRTKYDLGTDDKFVISGSSSHILRKEYSTLLTGRNRTYEVFPLSFEEFLLFKEIKMNVQDLQKGVVSSITRNKIINALNEYLEFGGLPEAVIETKEEKSGLLKQYFEDILYKDIVDRHKLNPGKAKDFLLYLMSNITGTISLRKIRGSLGLSYDAIKDYVSCAKEVFLIFVIDHFSYSFKEQKTLPGKAYCVDNGLRNAVSFKFSKDEGNLSENLVLVELKRRAEDIYYWKSEGQKEIDFVVKKKDDSLEAIQVTYTDEIEERETKSLEEFKKKFRKTKDLVVITKSLEKNEKGIKYVPLWKWLLTRR